MKQFIFILFISYMPAVSVADPSSSQARELLEKAINAIHQLNYDGVFVYQRDDQLHSMRIIHKVDDSGQSERLISLTGATREVVQDKGDVTCIYSDNKMVMIDKGGDSKMFLPSNLHASLPRIHNSYHFRLLGQERIVDRTTSIVEITPKDADRYTYRLWIDDTSYLILKSTIVDVQQQVNLETLMFTQLDIGSAVSKDLVEPMNTTKFSVQTNESEPKNNLLKEWQVGWLPSGFEIESTKTRTSSGIKPQIRQLVFSHLIYSDGLATTSIFIEMKSQVEASETGSGLISLGAVNAYTTTKDEYQVTVVGEIPAETVFKIASSVEHTLSIE